MCTLGTAPDGPGPTGTGPGRCDSLGELVAGPRCSVGLAPGPGVVGPVKGDESPSHTGPTGDNTCHGGRTRAGSSVPSSSLPDGVRTDTGNDGTFDSPPSLHDACPRP